MSKKTAVKTTTVPAMFTKQPATTAAATSTTEKETAIEDKSTKDRLVPWVEK